VPKLLEEGDTHKRQDLTLFWQEVDSIIAGLNLDVDIEDLCSPALHHLAPIIIGRKCWSMLPHLPHRWSDMKKAVTDKFGLTQEQLEDRFYNLKKEDKESTASFVTRVEGHRCMHNFSTRALIHSFDKHFSPKFKKQVKVIKTSIAVTQNRPIGWQDIVALAEEENGNENSDEETQRPSTPVSAPQTSSQPKYGGP
jgi:hypothetical protein